MELLFEGCMSLLFIAACSTVIYRLGKEKSVRQMFDRIFAITTCVGFFAGAVSKLVVSHVEWTFALYVIGVYVSYTATLFSFPKIGLESAKENEK